MYVPIRGNAACSQMARASPSSSQWADPKSSSEFVGLDHPTGRAGLSLTADEVHALLPHRSLGERPVSGRVLDRSYQEAARSAAANTSLALPPPRYVNPGK